MKIAVPYENGQVVLHLDKARTLKLYTVQDDEILSSQMVPLSDASPEALASLLSEQKAAALICGQLTVSAVIALQKAGIQILGGASGEADARVEDFLSGTLHFDRGSSCGSSCSSCASASECDGNISACGAKCW